MTHISYVDVVLESSVSFHFDSEAITILPLSHKLHHIATSTLFAGHRF